MSKANQVVFDAKYFLKQATQSPGVYVMHDSAMRILYVGKAKNLKKRLSSYFNDSGLAIKTQVLVKKIATIELTVTINETEALLLEQTLIKQYKPTYNICLRDDKSYPFILISSHQYPKLTLYRGKKRKNSLYGPYPSAYAAKESLKVLQKLFKVRQCSDHYFATRNRPCLQYQINRCKAPCVSYISKEDYAVDVDLSKQFLQGKSQHVFQVLMQKMNDASKKMDFEVAAKYRDQIKELQRMQKTQAVYQSSGHLDVDVIGLIVQAGIYSIAVLFIRSGALLGHRYFMPTSHWAATDEEVLLSFLSQFYISYADNRDYPKEIVLPFSVDQQALISKTIAGFSKHRIIIKTALQGDRVRWREIAQENAKQHVERYLANQHTMHHQLIALTAGLTLSKTPKQIECFDVSHLNGEETVASCVCFNQEGPDLKSYRRFIIRNITAGDDYAALKQAISRRYAQFEEMNDEAVRLQKIPDIIFIDGGKGQLSAIMPILETCNITCHVYGIVKGEGRKAGLETIIDARNGNQYQFEPNHLGFLLIQHIRNEAHRFALTGHKKRRDKKRNRSVLESVPGVGLKKRNALIQFFGGLQGLKSAEISDLLKVKGISRQIAENIFHLLHEA
ncbi:MAG: excinuclease ABC subunit UvrC [Endozoicomonadaceae bacterium]|nr:excinuclease ABC subunit UvrC [Endozoicomonadaceae bacterium]